MEGLLEGLKVIDMGQVEAAPVAAMWMADWGAEVIKVERFLNRSGTASGLGTSAQPQVTDIRWAFSLVVNRNKKSIAIDLKKGLGKDILYKLVQRSDVFISNYQKGALKNLNMDYATLSRLNPRLIYATISAYGSAGPDKDLGGYDFAAGWSRSGWQDLTREPGSPPSRLPGGVIDRSIAAPHIVAGILGALLYREKTGKGQELEVSLFQSSVWTIALSVQHALMGASMQNSDRRKAQNPLNNIYRTKDNRWIEFSTVSPDPYWHVFCQAIERPELENDPRFNSNKNRTHNCEELIRILDEAFTNKTMEEWDKRLREYNLIFAPVQTIAELLIDPQALANNFFVEMPNLERKTKVVATPVKFYQNPATVRTPAPNIGQHGEDILLDLGYSRDEIIRLSEQEVII